MGAVLATQGGRKADARRALPMAMAMAMAQRLTKGIRNTRAGLKRQARKRDEPKRNEPKWQTTRNQPRPRPQPIVGLRLGL